ncbi:MAG TPA: hypothetical protein VEG60_00630 [Candidatus Binatia bacterium]|nr:hypothetical protein [Candidatus Binatia bacterium]
MAKHLDLEVTLLGVYGGRLAGGRGEGFYSMDAFISNLRNETVTYLAAKTEEMKQRGLDKVSFAAKQGLEADEIMQRREKPSIR